MDKSAFPSSGFQSCSLDELNEQQDPSTAAPHQRSTSVVRNASMAHQPGGGSPCFNSTIRLSESISSVLSVWDIQIPVGGLSSLNANGMVWQYLLCFISICCVLGVMVHNLR
jgi:hypothetical protein